METYAAIVEALPEGWARVEEGTPMAGVDGVPRQTFGWKVAEHLERLADELRRRTYRPLPLLRFAIPKKDGGERQLHVPAVRDRVVQGAALHVLAPLVEPHLSPDSFAYRVGLGVADAIRRIERYRDDGFVHVVDADVERFFDSVSHERLAERLARLGLDAATQALLLAWMAAPAQTSDGARHERPSGLPQGALVSPMLANLVLDDLDDALAAEGLRIVRYADDFVVLCRTPDRARAALVRTDDVLEALALRLHPEKTRVTSFDDGFRFLGHLFVRSLVVPDAEADPARPLAPEVARRPALPSAPLPNEASPPTVLHSTLEASALGRAFLAALDAEGLPPEALLERFAALPAAPANPDVADDDALPIDRVLPYVEDDALAAFADAPTVPPGTVPFFRTLYVQEQGAWVRCQRGCLVVTARQAPATERLRVPLEKLQHVVVFGSVLLTPAAIRACLRRGVAVTFLSQRGTYYGRLAATDRARPARVRLQHLRTLDAPWALDLARRFVQGKLRNTRTMLLRFARTGVPGAAEAGRGIGQRLRDLDRAATLDELRGLEGAAAALAFDAFPALLDGTPFRFDLGRTRRPPQDPVNAMLSFGYTMLFNTALTFVHQLHLSPYVGVLHAERSGHPALVSDLIEEFRFLVDRLVLTLARKRIVDPSEFAAPPDGSPGCFMAPSARARVIGAFEQMFTQTLQHPVSGQTVSYRRALFLQVRAFAHHLEGRAAYVPFTPR